MFQKMIKKYKEYGLIGLILSGIGHEFKQTAKLFLNFAELVSTKVPLLYIEKEILIRNHIFKNKHKGCRCFVIGNGPSLNKQDLSLLSNEITIVVNAFWKNKIVEKWQPTYYCFADPMLFNGSESFRNFFHDLQTRVHSSTFLAPTYARKIIFEQELLPFKQTYYVAFRGSLSANLRYDIDLVKPIPGVMNVVQLGIMWAMYMGCSPIYLIGLNHDWLTHASTLQHFYKSSTFQNISNSIINNEEHINYKQNMQGVLKLWCGYENFLKYACKKNVKIINATKGGLLDVFERVEYEKIFKLKSNTNKNMF